MGIDLKSGGRRKGHNKRSAPVSKNVYVKLLEKLYRYNQNKEALLYASSNSSLMLFVVSLSFVLCLC